MKQSTPGVFLFIIIFTMACGSPEETFTVETKDGVKHVHNHAPLWGDEPKVGLEFVRQIGDFDAEDENYQFYRPQDIAVDSQENLYVLDAGNYRIQKFSPGGKFLATFGRQGQGPGELIMPYRIKLDRNGNIYVSDQSLKRIIVFNNEGKEIKRIPLPGGVRFMVRKSGNIAKSVFTHKGLILINS